MSIDNKLTSEELAEESNPDLWLKYTPSDDIIDQYQSYRKQMFRGHLTYIPRKIIGLQLNSTIQGSIIALVLSELDAKNDTSKHILPKSLEENIALLIGNLYPAYASSISKAIVKEIYTTLKENSTKRIGASGGYLSMDEQGLFIHTMRIPTPEEMLKNPERYKPVDTRY